MDSFSDKIFINTALGAAHSATIAADSAKAGERQAQREATLAREESTKKVESLADENRRLSSAIVHIGKVNEDLEKKNKEQEKVIERQKEVLKEWMVSQMAFKNLFKKYGKLPDGRSVDALPDEEKEKLLGQGLTEARAQVK